MKIIVFLFCLIASTSFASSRAVVLIDMQKRFFTRTGNHNNPESIERLNVLMEKQSQLLKWAVTNKQPILVFEFKGFGSTYSSLKKILKQHETNGYVLYAIKSSDNGFEKGRSPISKIKKFLRDHNANNLIIAGVNGPFCVYKTILGALDEGYTVDVAQDTVANFAEVPIIYPSYKWSQNISSDRLRIFDTIEEMFWIDEFDLRSKIF